MAISHDKLPRNPDAEKAILGGMLTSRTVLDQALAALHIDEFYMEHHQKIFQAIVNLNDKNSPIDIQTVTQELKNMKALEFVGGVDYLFALTQSLILPDHANEYIDIVKSNGNLRKLLLAFNEIEDDYLKKDISYYTEFVAKAQAKIDSIAEERKISNFKSSKEVVDIVSHQVLELSQSKSDGDLSGVDTGFKKLNFYTDGLQPENLVIVAGRTGLGKTAFALNLILNAAKTGSAVALFEMEMSAFTLYSRLVANEAYVPGKHILNGRLNAKEIVRVKSAFDRLAGLKIFVDESSALTIYDLVAKARKLKSEQPDLSMIVIDYLGLISSDNKKTRKRFDNRQQEIQEYTRALHELARELKIPIVLLCQLNRKVEDREAGAPRLSDLRESGSIEQDAEIVLLLHSPEYGKNELTDSIAKAKQQKTTAANMSDEARKNLMDNVQKNAFVENTKDAGNNKNNVVLMNVIIAKNRNGESGPIVKLMFEKDYSKFTDASEDFLNQERALATKYQ